MKLEARSQPKMALSLNKKAAQLIQAAEDDYRRALEITPTASGKAIIHYSRHTLRLLAENLEGAALDLEDAKRLSEGPWLLPYLSLAQVFQRMKRDPEADENIVEAIRRVPQVSLALPHAG